MNIFIISELNELFNRNLLVSHQILKCLMMDLPLSLILHFLSLGNVSIDFINGYLVLAMAF